MSGIFGIVSLDGAPIDSEVLQAMGQRVSAPFGGAYHIYECDGAALGQTGTEDPASSPKGVAVCDARIDNLDEVRARRGLDAKGGLSSEFLASYETYGRDAAKHMYGDFSFAVLDTQTRELMIGVDIFAVRPLYYHVGSEFIAFASTPDAFRCTPFVPLTPDPYRVADYLVPPLEWSDSRRTFFQRVSRVPPAHVVVIDPSGREKEHRWWRAEPQTAHGFRNAKEMGESLRPLILDAIRSRIHGEPATGLLLSGGVDSGTLLGASRAAGASIHTFSAVESNEQTCPDARFVRNMLTGHSGPCDVVSPQTPGFLSEPFREMLKHCDALFALTQAGLRAGLFWHAGRKGMKQAMVGIGPDELLAVNQSTTWALLRHLRVPSALRTLQAYRHGYSCSLPSAVIHQIVRPFLPSVVRRITGLRRPFKQRRSSDMIRVKFAQETQVWERLADAFRRTKFLPPPHGVAAMLNGNDYACAFERYAQSARPFGLTVTYPFVDRRIVDWSLALRGADWAHLPYFKGPLVAANVGWVPPAVRTRRWAQNPDFSKAFFKRHEDWTAGYVPLSARSDWVADMTSGSFPEAKRWHAAVALRWLNL